MFIMSRNGEVQLREWNYTQEYYDRGKNCGDGGRTERKREILIKKILKFAF